MLLREGRRQGAQHMVVTHAIHSPIFMSVPEMQEAAKQGAFIELSAERPPSFKGGGAKDAAEYAARIDKVADAIRKVGPEFCILSSDLGQGGNPVPTDGLAGFVVALRNKGFTQQELDRVTKQNPAGLLGLP